MFQIEIPKRSGFCCLNGEPFAPGMEYHSVITRNNDNGVLERRDYCCGCWKHKQAGGEKAILSNWKSIVPPAKRESPLPKQRDERARMLLKEALKLDSSESEGEAFVLALYLARRRRILLRQEVKEEGKKWISLYEDVETEEMYCVLRQSLSNLEVEVIQNKLAAKFHG